MWLHRLTNEVVRYMTNSSSLPARSMLTFRLLDTAENDQALFSVPRSSELDVHPILYDIHRMCTMLNGLEIDATILPQCEFKGDSDVFVPFFVVHESSKMERPTRKIN